MCVRRGCPPQLYSGVIDTVPLNSTSIVYRGGVELGREITTVRNRRLSETTRGNCLWEKWPEETNVWGVRLGVKVPEEMPGYQHSCIPHDWIHHAWKNTRIMNEWMNGSCGCRISPTFITSFGHCKLFMFCKFNSLMAARYSSLFYLRIP